MTRTCARCGKSFEAKRSDARLCSPACRQAASREARGIKQGRRRRRARSAGAPSDVEESPAVNERRLAAVEGGAAGRDSTRIARLERQVCGLGHEVDRLRNIAASAEALAAKVVALSREVREIRAALAKEAEARRRLQDRVVALGERIVEFAEVLAPGG